MKSHNRKTRQFVTTMKIKQNSSESLTRAAYGIPRKTLKWWISKIRIYIWSKVSSSSVALNGHAKKEKTKGEEARRRREKPPAINPTTFSKPPISNHVWRTWDVNYQPIIGRLNSLEKRIELSLEWGLNFKWSPVSALLMFDVAVTSK